MRKCLLHFQRKDADCVPLKLYMPKNSHKETYHSFYSVSARGEVIYTS